VPMQTTFPDLDRSGILRTEAINNISEFLHAVKNAEAGDLITLANGSYDVDGDTSFSRRRGTARNPIIVTAEDVGKVTLKGSTGYKFENCEYFTWYGFNHMHEASTDDNISFKGGSNNRFARCEVKLNDRGSKTKGERKTHWLQISNCKAMKVDHCFFHQKPSEGQFCNVSFAEDNEPGKGPLFEYNYFQHQDYNKIVGEDKVGDAGGEGIQMGNSAHARRFYRAIVRYNCFEECNGDGELVTNKSCGNLYYNNTFTDCNASLTLRHGHSTAVLANYFKNCGLRILGANNLIANNHFTDNSRSGNRRPLVIHNGKEDGGYERVVNNHIILNTFANGSGRAKEIVVWGSGDGSGEPSDNKFKGNIITARNGKLFELGEGVTASGNEISDNVRWIADSADDGDLTEEMATRTDPLLTRDPNDGIYRLQSSSPARNKFTGKPFSSLTSVDIDGEDRGPNTDAGCDQFSTASTRPKKRITPEDVGPNARTDLGDSPLWNGIPQPVNPQDQ
jgi:poly(beta-D-mannuronate) lyase